MSENFQKVAEKSIKNKLQKITENRGKNFEYLPK